MSSGQPRVLLYEEDPSQTEIYSELVKNTVDCKLDVLGKTEGSLDSLNHSFQNYQLVIVDIPAGGDALGWLERIKRQSPSTSVILVVSRGSIEEAVAAIRSGAEDYFDQPANVDRLQHAIRRALDRSQIFDQSASAASYLNLLFSCQQISAALEPTKVFDILHGHFQRELETQHLAFYDERLKRLDIATSEIEKDRAMEEVLDIAVQAAHTTKSFADHALGGAGEFYRFIERSNLTPGLFVFRFKLVGGREYSLIALSPKKPTSLEDFESRIKLLHAQLEVTGKNIEKYQGVKSLAFVDDATGLYNTRYLNTILDHEFHQAELSRRSFAVLFIDIDRFKQVNDTYGHLVGTRILNDLGGGLRSFVRESDVVFRYGGDEFVAVLSPSDLKTAESVAERIRKSIEERTFMEDEGLSIQFTVSVGVALYPTHASTKKEIIEAADHAMYAAKKSSRNRVFIATEKAPVSQSEMLTEEGGPLRVELKKTPKTKSKKKKEDGKKAV